jgi:hypothetical protein
MKDKTVKAMRAAVAKRKGPPAGLTDAQRIAQAKQSLIERGGWKSGVALEPAAHKAVQKLAAELGGVSFRAAIEVALLYAADPANLGAVVRSAKEARTS